jgi:polyhydroxybutyrate depolymerase
MSQTSSRAVTGKYVAILAAAAVTLGACSKSSTPPATSTPTTLKAATGGSGCNKPAPTGTTIDSFRIGGRARAVIVHVPTGYTGSKQVALVLNMHGSGSDAVEQEGFTGMDATSDSDGFIVAYPQGLITDGSGFDWNVPGVPLFGGRPVPAGAPDDVAFLTTLVGVLENRYCIDANRVYATGFSGGARLSSQLACDASKVFAAVAPVSGLRRPLPCPASRAVPIISFHGTSDPVDPYNGNGQKYWTYSVPQAERYWATQDGCSTTPATSSPVATVTLTEYTGCRDGAVIELYTIAGEGHEWPGGPHLVRRITRLLGPQTTAIDADQLIWSFFSAHSLSAS